MFSMCAAALPPHTCRNEPGDIAVARFLALIMAVLSAGQFRGVVEALAECLSAQNFQFVGFFYFKQLAAEFAPTTERHGSDHYDGHPLLQY
jgi:hypothetical protein